MKGVLSEIRYLGLTSDQGKGEMVEYPIMGDVLLYETKEIAVKWENEFYSAGKIKRSIV